MGRKARGGWNEWEGSGEITGGARASTSGGDGDAGDNSDGSYNRSEEGGKHGYVEESVRERASREEMTKGWQGMKQGGIDQKQNSGTIVNSSL